jgi:hypothetical protein
MKRVVGEHEAGRQLRYFEREFLMSVVRGTP